MDESNLIKNHIEKKCSHRFGQKRNLINSVFISIVIAWIFGIYSHQTDMLVHKDIKVDEYRGSLFRFFKHPTQIHFSFGGVAISGD